MKIEIPFFLTSNVCLFQPLDRFLKIKIPRIYSRVKGRCEIGHT